MTNVDLDILEFLNNEGNNEIAATPLVIAVNTSWGIDTVREHVLTLRNYSLLEYEDRNNGIYRLSPKGRKYLEGELDPSQLESA